MNKCPVSEFALIGYLIKQARIKKKHSQTQAGSKLGVDKTTISSWELSKRNPKEFHFEKISNYIEMPIFDLMKQVQKNGNLRERELYESRS